METLLFELFNPPNRHTQQVFYSLEQCGTKHFSVICSPIRMRSPPFPGASTVHTTTVRRQKRKKKKNLVV